MSDFLTFSGDIRQNVGLKFVNQDHDIDFVLQNFQDDLSGFIF